MQRRTEVTMIELNVANGTSSPLQAWILRSQKEIAARLGKQ